MTKNGNIDAVTGAFSYSGAAIAGELRTAGRGVRTLTGHPGRAPAGSEIDVRPLNFTDPTELEASLRGTHTLYNLLGAVRPRRCRPSGRRREQPDPVPGRRAGRGPAHRARLDNQPEPDLPVPIFPWQGRGGAAPRRGWRPVCDRPSGNPVRRRRCVDQQRGMAVATPAAVRHRRSRRLPGARNPRRRPGPVVCRDGCRQRLRRARRGGAAAADVS